MSVFGFAARVFPGRNFADFGQVVLFAGSFAAVVFHLITFDRMLLVLTTIVSLEAIYLSIFIQMTINFQQQSLEEVEQDIDE